MNKIRFGERFKNTIGLGFWVVAYHNCKNVVIEFDISKCRVTTQAGQVRSGRVRDRLTPSVCGVGFLGVGIHKSSIGNKPTKTHKVWSSMIERCYSRNRQQLYPSYDGCKVCEEWHNFQVFAEWFELNYKEGLAIDKDILGNGKLYSPDMCCFVTLQDNSEAGSAKFFTFISPEGVFKEIYNLSKFCRDNNLHRGAMTYVNSGKVKHHKGWRAESIAAGMKDGTVVL